MELTAFMNWLLLQDDPVNQLIYEAKQQNPQVVDILELAGDATYDMETFIKAIDKLKELKEAETKAIPVELPVMLRCQYCNKPIKELLDIDEDDETLRLPFCDEQCMEAYKEEHPEYFD